MKKVFDWIVRLGLAGLFVMAGGMKWMEDPQSVRLFTALGMEPAGRLIIGTLELLAAGLLLIPATTARGALLAFWILLGAFLAHATRIGFGDALSLMWAGGFTAACLLLALHRHELPFLSQAFERR